MSQDPQFMRLLMETFQSEVQEQVQQITDALLGLEKADSQEHAQELLHAMFRCAHNIKGAAGGVHAGDVAELAHALESLFSLLRAGEAMPDAGLVDLCLQALDHVRHAAAPDLGEAALPLSRPELLNRLKAAAKGSLHPTAGMAGEPSAAVPESDSREPARDAIAAPTESVRVPVGKLLRVSALADELQVIKIAMGEHFTALQTLHADLAKLEMRMRVLRPAARAKAKDGAKASVKTENAEPVLVEGRALVTEMRVSAGRISKTMRSNASRMGLLTSALQNEIRMLQLVPIATTVRPMVRMVRDLGRELGKQVRLQISGDHIEMDRAVLDGIRDPLLHLMRNAVDHGLEVPSERTAAGKPEEGLILLAVSSEGGRIQIDVRDDGRGIDARDVVRVALRRNLIQPDEAERMDAQARLELIFRPGFSSKEIITNLSGRGVGLDVVAANLRMLNGSVRLETTPGKGSFFRLQVPLTLTTERGLHVVAGGEDVVIPSASVERIIDIAPQDVLEVASNLVVMVKHKPVPLRELAATLQLPTGGFRRHARIPVVVVSMGWTTVAFMVEDVVGAREIVVKRLMPPLGTVRHISGATVTGSGDIMMVLNASELVDTALRQRERVSFRDPDARPAPAQAPHILVVDDSLTTRALEKNILEAQGFTVTVATNGEQGWDLLQKQKYALVVTDVEMPRMSGFELTQRIKQHQSLADVPVIIVTSLATEEDRRRGVEVGADAYFVKSAFDTRTLIDVVRQLV